MEIQKLAGAYYRVSTSNQENEGTIETQISAVKDFADKNGYTIIQEYKDEGWSGDSLARPNLDQLRMDAKKKNWQTVLIYDPDRLARRASWQEVVIEELKEIEIEVRFVTIPPPKTDEDIIMYKMRGVFSEYERMKIKERFRLGKVRKAQEGHVITSEAPYGYTFITKKGKRGDADFRQGYYEINAYEAQVVRSLFSWVDEGLTLRAVVRKLQGLNIKPRWSKRGVWNTSTLSTLLRNKTYIGEAHFGASYAVIPSNPFKTEGYKKVKKTSRRMKPEEEWIKIPTLKLIDENLFTRVGQKLKSNFLMSQRNTKNEYLLAGKIYCICGQRRAGEGPQRGKYLYYRCCGRVNSFPLPPSCKEKGLNAHIVDKIVWDKVKALMSSPDLLLKQAERWLNKNQTQIPNSGIGLEETRKEVVKLKDQEDRYVKAYGAGAITIEQLKEHTGVIREKISLFNDQIIKVELEVSQTKERVLPATSEIESFTQKAIQTLGDLKFEGKKAIVRSIIDKAVGTVGKLEVYGYIPIELDINVCTKDRNCGTAKRGKIHAF